MAGWRVLLAVVTLAGGIATGVLPDQASLPSVAAAAAAEADPPRVLVFHRTELYRHASIPHALAVLRTLGQQHGFAVDDTLDASAFTAGNLARYRAVVWLSTSGEVLNGAQQTAFEQFIQAGGGYVGVHAASHTEHDWPWYGELMGAWFATVQEDLMQADLHVEDHVHPSSAFLPATWVRTDEWYNFERNPRGPVNVLATLDEDTYTGGTMGDDHPIAWCHAYDGGLSWYTAGGHSGSAYDEPLFRNHLLHGIEWAARLEGGTCGATTTTPLPPPPPPPTPTTTTTTTPTVTPGRGVVPDGASRFVAVVPQRLLDTRIGQGSRPGPVAADGVLRLAVAGQGAVPVDATAVALNLTATDAGGAGYVTAWPSGRPRPTASTLNVEHPGHTVANLAVLALGDGGAIDLYAQTATHLVADVAGYWVPSGAVGPGRFVAVNPARVVDTRDGTGAPPSPLAADGELAVQVTGRGGVPVTGVSAVAVTVTATGTTGPGFVTVWGDGPRPLVSNLNVGAAGQTVPNLAIVPVDPEGRLRLSAQTATDVVVDVAGWFTDASAPAVTDGLFVALTPARLLDSRTQQPVAGVFGAGLAAGTRADLAVSGRGGVPGDGVAAVVANLTATATSAPSFVTVHPAGTAQPNASNLNVTHPDQSVANLAIARLGHGGRVSLVAQEPLDLIVDVAGWFLGTPTTPDPGVSLEPPAA